MCSYRNSRHLPRSIIIIRPGVSNEIADTAIQSTLLSLLAQLASSDQNDMLPIM